MKRLMAILGLAVGLGLGLLYTWVISPVQYTDTDPTSLRADDKARWIQLSAEAYAVDGDVERARVRIMSLGEPDPARAVTALAQRTAASGQDPAAVRSLAALAAALGAGPAPGVSPIEPQSAAGPTVTPEPSLTPEPSATPQLLPTSLPSPTPPGAFAFVSQAISCNAQSQPPLLQVVAQDAQGTGVPGVEVIVEWDGGQDHFFTGLKPELGVGYGDFAMDVNVLYTVRLASAPSVEYTTRSEPCTDDGGHQAASSVQLIFRQP